MNNSQLSVLRNPSLLTIGIAESVSGIGNWITMMSVFALLVFRGGGGVSESSGVFLVGLIPALIFSPVAGWLCDRYDRKMLMIFSEVASGIIIAGLIFTKSLVLIYTLLGLQALSMSIMTPARQSSVPSLVSPEGLTTANAFLQQLSSLVKIFAPMLAGLILTIVPPQTAIILDVVSFALSALILTRLKPLIPQKSLEIEKSKTRFLIKVKTYFAKRETPVNQDSFLSTFSRSASLKMLFIGLFLSIFVIVGFDVLAAVYFRDTLLENEGFYGLAIGLVGVGSLLSTVILMTKKTSNHAWKDVVAGISLLSTIPLSMAFASTIQNIQTARILVLTFCFIGGIGNGLLHIQASTLLQSFTPSRMLGEGSGLLQSTIIASQLVGTILTPLLVPGLLNMENYFLFAFTSLALVVFMIVVQLIRSPKNFILPQIENQNG